nr:beta-carotene 15,15'-monooxygenase [uncultured Gardnerella sp.]
MLKNLPQDSSNIISHTSRQTHSRIMRCTWRFLHIPLLVLLIITLFECSIGNIPFWSSVTGSTDSASVHNSLGSGVKRLKSGGLLITDPSEAYLEVISDGSSPYIRLQPSRVKNKLYKKQQIIDDIHTRVEANKYLSKPQSTNPRALNASLLSIPEEVVDQPCVVRVWLQHPAGAILDVEDARANVRAPFSWSWGRVSILIVFAILIALWNPWSKLWKIKLNTSSISQRFYLFASWMPFIIIALATIIWNLRNATPMHFDSPGNYAYDFDQYAHTADALAKGQVHLNLPVPHELTTLPNPYDPMARNNLLNHSVPHMYWDYAYYKGHWYSYFGVLPAVLLFLPYRLITSIWIPGGAMLPTTVATFVFLIAFLIAGSLLVIRIIENTVKNASLGTVSISLALFFISANTVYLWFRTSFYSVPMAASLFFTSLGLWFYLGAFGNSKTNSFRNIALGSFFIALNLGCRPTFVIAVLFAIPVLYPILKKSFNDFSKDWKKAEYWRIPLLYATAWILPAVITAIPFGVYNLLRFGSPLNFGNEYQITITDMTTMRLPSQNILPSILSYIALPLRLIPTFPWIGIQPVAFDRWQYAEPMIGGMFVLSPLALVSSFAALAMRKRCLHKISWNISITSLIIGVFLIVFDSLKAGIGWRYIADFAWTFAITAIVGVTLLLEHAASVKKDDCWQKKTISYSIRFVVITLLFVSIIIAALSWFVTGREDSTLRFNPDLWYLVRSWLTLF